MKLLQSPDNLANQLKNGQITDRDHYHFLTAFLFLYGLVAQPTLLNAVVFFKTEPVYEFFNMLAFIITIWEIETCFYINRRGDQGDFLSRYTCLSFAVSIRYFALFYLSYLAIWGIATLSFMEDSYGFLRFTSAILTPLTSYGIYLKMRSLFEFVASDSNSSPASSS